LLYNKDTKLEITGIAADPPSNTEMDFDFVASLKGAETNPLFKEIVADARIGAGNFPTWFRLRTAPAAAQVTRTLNRMATADARDTSYGYWHRSGECGNDPFRHHPGAL
jgi:putative ABC transport system permease protein